MALDLDQTLVVRSRCAFNNKGVRCTAIADVTHPYCIEHTKFVLGVEVRQSQIVQAGLGLWAVRDIPANTHLFDYGGERLSKRDYDERYADVEMGVYGIALNSRTVIDARCTDAGVARYICTYQGSGSLPNVQYLSTGKTIEMWTTRDIRSGEELLADYGDEMLQAMGVLSDG
ncbi:MAG: SET domain-containing protein [Candidatus Kapabacteria bacterium]|nr:SET domain-containing protein [Candidatus Kapabacteria bacterium]